MSISSILRVRTIVAIAAAMIVAVTAYGFAASNSVAASNAGDGTGAISGYAVSATTYVLNETNPNTIDSLTLTIAPDNSGNVPSTVKVQLTNGGTWYDGTHGTGNIWSVDLTSASVTVLSVDNLRVVAAD